MSITCKLIELVYREYDPPFETPGGGKLLGQAVDRATGEPPQPGDIFFEDDDYLQYMISAKHAGKRPVVVVLPTGLHFCIYSMQVTDGVLHEPGWDVSGEPPNCTVSPSINVKGNWHGFLTNGELK